MSPNLILNVVSKNGSKTVSFSVVSYCSTTKWRKSDCDLGFHHVPDQSTVGVYINMKYNGTELRIGRDGRRGEDSCHMYYRLTLKSDGSVLKHTFSTYAEKKAFLDGLKKSLAMINGEASRFKDSDVSTGDDDEA